MKGKTKIIFFFFLGISFLFYLIGCAAIQNPFSRAIWGDTKEARSRDRNLTNFFSTIRSPRGNPNSHYLLACYYQKQGRHKEAIEEFHKTLLINPGDVKAYNGLGISYDLLGNFSEAVESYEKALKLDPFLDYLYNNLGHSYMLQGNLDKAIASFQKAISLNGQESRFHNNLGSAYAEKGQFDQAMTEFKLAGDDFKAHYNMAEIYYKKGLYREAKNHYAAAFSLNPSSPVLRTRMEATSALTAIFQSDTQKAKEEKLAISKPLISTETLRNEFKDSVQSTPAKEEAAKPIPHGQWAVTSDWTGMGTAHPSARNSLPPVKRVTPEELKIFNFADQSADSLSPKKTRSESTNTIYELQVASFRSQKRAAVTAKALQGSGYKTSLSPWKNGDGNEWYRVFVGPFVSRDETLICMKRIENRYKFRGMKVLSTSGKGKEEKWIVRDRPKEFRESGSINGVGIEISNGNGVNGMARMIGNYLQGKGLKVIRLTNAKDFNYSQTRIFYRKGYHEISDHLASQLPVQQNAEEIKNFDRPYIKVKVLLGKDLLSKKYLFKKGKRT